MIAPVDATVFDTSRVSNVDELEARPMPSRNRTEASWKPQKTARSPHTNCYP